MIKKQSHKSESTNITYNFKAFNFNVCVSICVYVYICLCMCFPSMTRCELTLPVFSVLEEVLRGGSKLQCLALGLNKVGDLGAKHIWSALKHGHCNLKDLE